MFLCVEEKHDDKDECTEEKTGFCFVCFEGFFILGAAGIEQGGGEHEGQYGGGID